MPVLDTCVPVLAHRQPGRAATKAAGRYVGSVTVTADQIAAALREHLPHADGPRLHRLLYYIQGHHLALYGQPAFAEAIAAGPDGPYVHGLPEVRRAHAPGTVNQATLTVTAIVAARYGRLSTGDLNRLTCAETPWRASTVGQRISHDLLREFFTGPGRPDEPTHPLLQPDPARDQRVREEVERLHRGEAPRRPDDLERLAGEVRGARRR